MMPLRPLLPSVAIALLLGVASPARADVPDAATTQTAVRLSDEASTLFQAGKFADALNLYERAFALVRRPTLGVRIARCLERLGRLNEASERYLTVSRMALPPDLDPDKLAKQREATIQADAERNALMPRIPGVIIQLKGPATATVTIDDVVIPQALFGMKRAADPGLHHIVAKNGDEVVTRDVTLKEGEVQTTSIELREPPPALITQNGTAPTTADTSHTSPMRTIGFVGIGVGAAGLALGVVSGLLALSGQSDLQGKCGDSLACSNVYASNVSAYNTERILTSVGLIAGGVLAATGVVLVFTAPKSGARVTGVVGANSVSVGGTF